MPEPITGTLPPLIPSTAAVDAVAETIYDNLSAANPGGWADMSPLAKHFWRNLALEALSAAGPKLTADAVQLVADNRMAFGLDALDSLFDFEALAVNVAIAAGSVPAT